MKNLIKISTILLMALSLAACRKESDRVHNFSYSDDLVFSSANASFGDQFKLLWEALNSNYAIWDYEAEQGLDWDEVFETYYPKFVELDTLAKTRQITDEEFTALVKAVVAPLHDGHLAVDMKNRSTGNFINVNPGDIRIHKERAQEMKDLDSTFLRPSLQYYQDNGTVKEFKTVDATLQAQFSTSVGAANKWIGENLDYKSFAVLYRTNVQSRALEEALRRENIPYRIYQGLSFYGRKEIKDVLAYLRLVVNNYDEESLLRVINYPARGIGQTSLDRVRVAAADNDIAVWTVLENLPSFGLGITSGTTQKIGEFVMMIKRFSSMLATMNAYDLAKQIIYNSGIITLLRNDDDPDNPNRIENIEELLNGVKEFCEKEAQFAENGTDEEQQPESAGGVRTLDQFLQQVLLLTSEDKDEDKDADKVSLMTIHAAKGLEFPYVYVAGLEENLFPSFMSISSRQELEEERRLFYVAVTRAERQLTLSYAMTRYQYGNSSCQEMSRFVEEIDPKYIEMPQRKSQFPKPGVLPKAFQGVKGVKWSPEAERDFQRKPAPEPQKPRRLQPKSSLPQGPTAPNSAAEINAIQVGMRVRHAKFGEGKVLTIEGSGNDRKATIFFDQVGQKTMMLVYAKLVIINQ